MKDLYWRLTEHVSPHEVELVTYGWPIRNVALECTTCGMVLLDIDAPARLERKA